MAPIIKMRAIKINQIMSAKINNDPINLKSLSWRSEKLTYCAMMFMNKTKTRVEKIDPGRMYLIFFILTFGKR